MLQVVNRILLTAVVIVLCGCSHFDLKGLFVPTSEGVEARFEQSREVNKDLKAGTVEAGDGYAFYVAADPHIDKTHINLGRFNDAFRNDAEASFGVVLGDCIDVRDNLPAYLEALSYNPDTHAFNPEIFHILGNHDLFFNGWVAFKEQVGPSVYWFEVAFAGGKDLYISLDTATGTLGRKQTEWFRSFLTTNRQSYRHCIILTHTNIFYADTSQTSSGNLPIEETLSLIDFLDDQNVTLVMQGHDHYREDLSYGKVRYVILGTIKDGSDAPEYLKISVDSYGANLNWQMII